MKAYSTTLLLSAMIFATVVYHASAMKIYIDVGTWRKVDYQVEPSDTISSLKDKIEAREKISRDKQFLWFYGQDLEDDKTIQDYKIGEGMFVHLIKKTNADRVKQEKRELSQRKFKELFGQGVEIPGLVNDDPDSLTRRALIWLAEKTDKVNAAIREEVRSSGS